MSGAGASIDEANRLAEPPDVTVRNFAVCEVQRGMRLIGAPVDAMTAYLVLAGNMHMSLPGQPAVTAPEGALVLLPAGLQPSIAPDNRPAIDVVATRNCLVNNEGLLVFDAAHGGAGDLRVLVGSIGASGSTPEALLGRVTTPVVDKLSELKVAREAYALIRAELKQPKHGSAALAASLMKTCVVLFARRRSRADPTGQPVVGGKIAGIAGIIRARPADSYSLESLAAMAGMSRSTFVRQFSDATGFSPMEYVLKARLKHAASLLDSTGMSIKQVAAASGFLSRSHFSRAFRLEFGLDPRGFRDGQGDEDMPRAGEQGQELQT